ncbi:hypothetical protein SARC_02051 [Sphaeroforma arctica JP610]|uniref:Methyltransferase domain-containing protein n=1 Tax=Sphaeroforma arctica JP610 TaxID=667725 RepID=A0A0L0GC08_9EUKA|nr:hypothetical protein SARC_02051 [Sphaeroforma arctica JP610]KNC85788.1 hypothetical protein SARC_02051 [Sphaeroforma arctica JP610]|eukprot:XP_014159690.1 hypothetical protein SARC_02051 [Sphaeroforma arctica JP610]
MLDAPCGDMTWMPIFLESAGQAVSYHGCDYLSSVIETAKKKFTPLHPEWKFTRCDLTKELPLNGAFDLLFTHQLLSFLPRDKILEVIHTVKNSQARYWMVNAHDKVQKNNRRLSRSGGESPTSNLLEPPYNLDKEWIVSTVDTADDPETSSDTDKMVVIDMKMLREGWPSKSVDGSDEKIAVEKDRFDHDRYHRMQNGDTAEHHDAQEVEVEAELPAEGPESESEDFDPMSNNFIGSGGSLDDREGDFLAEEYMDYMGVKPDKAPKYRDSQDGDHSIPESTLSATKSLRKGMGRLINKFRIKSMLDAPCGEMTWMPAFLEEYGDGVHYTGCDILSSVVRRGNKHIATSGSEFIRCDLTTWLPNDGEYDLVITRNTLHSLSDSLVMDALHVVKDSKIKYWLVENYNGTHANHELPEGVNAHRPVNLFTYPFNFERDWVIDTIEEKEADPRHSEHGNRHKSNHEGHFQMVLMDVQMIRDFWGKHRQITRT